MAYLAVGEESDDGDDEEGGGKKGRERRGNRWRWMRRVLRLGR